MTNNHNTPTILTSLRSLTPQRRLDFTDALRIAELQATKLGELLDDDHGIHDHHIAGLPRINVHYDNLPISGMSHWNGRQWVITIAESDSPARQRFTLLHEFKHIIDHGQTETLYAGDRNRTGAQQAELAADYFAGCALVPRRALKRAWGNRVQRVPDLAHYFGVSEPAIRVRLAQTGLDLAADHAPAPRCARPTRTPRGHAQRFRVVQPAYPRRSYA